MKTYKLKIKFKKNELLKLESHIGILPQETSKMKFACWLLQQHKITKGSHLVRLQKVWLTTRATREAVGMIEVTHCLASLARSIHTFSTFYTNTYKEETERMLEFFSDPKISSGPLNHSTHSTPKSMSSSTSLDSNMQVSSRQFVWNKYIVMNPK